MAWFIVIGWVFCGIMSYGYLVARFQRTYALIADDYIIEDRILATFVGLCGPIGLAVVLIRGDYKQGWML